MNKLLITDEKGTPADMSLTHNTDSLLFCNCPANFEYYPTGQNQPKQEEPEW